MLLSVSTLHPNFRMLGPFLDILWNYGKEEIYSHSAIILNKDHPRRRRTRGGIPILLLQTCRGKRQMSVSGCLPNLYSYHLSSQRRVKCSTCPTREGTQRKPVLSPGSANQGEDGVISSCDRLTLSSARKGVRCLQRKAGEGADKVVMSTLREGKEMGSLPCCVEPVRDRTNVFKP